MRYITTLAVIGILFLMGCTPETYLGDPNPIIPVTDPCPNPIGMIEVYYTYQDIYLGWYELATDSTVTRWDGSFGNYSIADGQLSMSFLNGDSITFTQDGLERCHWTANPTGTAEVYFDVDRVEVTGRE